LSSWIARGGSAIKARPLGPARNPAHGRPLRMEDMAQDMTGHNKRQIVPVSHVDAELLHQPHR
jgi:hypothetical protein